MINQAVLDKIKPGATVRVLESVTEVDKKGKEKTRKSRFEGLVLARKHGSEAGATFTVRSTVGGIGVEKVFPIHMPSIEKVEIISSPKKVKKSKLYYMRDLSRKALRKKLSNVFRKGAAMGDAETAANVADNVGQDEAPKKEEINEHPIQDEQPVVREDGEEAKAEEATEEKPEEAAKEE